jgi:hypothetical protein
MTPQEGKQADNPVVTQRDRSVPRRLTSSEPGLSLRATDDAAATRRSAWIASVGYRCVRQSYRIRLPPNSLTIGKGVPPPP